MKILGVDIPYSVYPTPKSNDACPLCDVSVDAWVSFSVYIGTPTMFCIPCGHAPFTVPGADCALSPELLALLILRAGDY